MIARVNICVADVRAEPNNRSERVSQGLLNEIVQVLGEAPSFSMVRFSDGYKGWIAHQFLCPHDKFPGDGPYIVQANIASAYDKPDISSRPIARIPYGCCLYGEMADGFLEMPTERWGSLYVEQINLLEKSEIAPLENLMSDKIVIEAEKFLGVPYLWGGRSFFGTDCSGYVKAIFARFARELPRDTKEQIKAGTEVGRKDFRRGDLLFFPGHVALAITNTLFIHSSRLNGGVAYNSFDSKESNYRADLDKSFKTARRLLA